MSFIDDWNNQASQAAQTGGSQSWDEYYRRQEQQRILSELKNKNAAPKKGGGNFLTSLIPTGGGIGGALAGAAGGAALGSVVPVLGTAVGGLLGAIAGGAGGSALGKVGQNAVEGEQDLGKGVAQEALLGGVTSTPLGAGFKVLKAGAKAATGIGKTSARELLQQAGTSTVSKGTAAKYGLTNTPATAGKLGNKLGTSLENTGNKMLASQTGMTNAQARRNGIGSQINTFGNVNKRTGLTNLDDMAEVSRGLTGAGDDSLLDTLTRASVESSKGVKVDDLRTAAQKLIDDKGSLLSDTERKSILRNVKNASTTMYGGSAGSLSTLANPTAAFDQANNFRATARSISDSALTATPAQKQIAGIYNNLANNLEKSIYKSPGVNESLPTLIKSGRDDLLFRADDLAAAGNKAQADAYRKIANELGGVKNINQLRTMKRDFVDLGKIDRATGQAEGSRTLGGKDLTNSLGSFVRNPLNLLGAPIDAATPTAAGAIAGLGRGLQGGGLSTGARAAGQGVLPLAARQGAGRILTADTAPEMQLDEQGLTAEDYASLQSNPLFAQQDLNPSTLGTGEAPQPTNPFGISLQDVAAQMTNALSAGDTKGYATLSDLYDRINDYEAKTGEGALGATARTGLATSANAINTVDQLENLFAQTGGGSGRIGGAVQNLLGAVGANNNVDLYNSQLNSSLTQLAKAVNGGGQVTDADAKAFIDSLPRVNDNPEVAAQKFAELRRKLQVAAQNTAQYGGGSTDLTSILAQYGQ
jgi:hypothetical protein